MFCRQAWGCKEDGMGVSAACSCEYLLHTTCRCLCACRVHTCIYNHMLKGPATKLGFQVLMCSFHRALTELEYDQQYSSFFVPSSKRHIPGPRSTLLCPHHSPWLLLSYECVRMCLRREESGGRGSKACALQRGL